MKIAMVSTPFVAVPPRDYGGTELVVHELTEGLVARGHEVTLFATGDSRTSGRLEYLYPEAHWPPDIMTDMNHVSWALQQIKQGDYDLMHVHSAGALAFARLMPSVPLVYTLHHVRDEALSEFYRYFPEPQYIAISAEQARLEIPLPKLEVIHHGIDASLYDWRPSPENYVAFIGRFAEIKGAHTAIDVAGRAGVPIRVAGSTHEVDLEFGAREIEPRLRLPHVTYLGKVGLDRKVPMLRDALALLVPITWDEPFGLVIIEAMLSGCPVIAFPRGSVMELVEEGVTGFIAHSESEMAELLRADGPLQDFDRKRCRERAVERFSRTRMVEQHERLYRKLIGQATPPALRVHLGAA